MTEIQLFDNGEFSLRLVGTGDSFRASATEVARALGFHSAKDMVRTIPAGEKGWETAPTLGGDQRVWYLTETGFYRALGQRQPARIRDAEIRKQVTRFQTWVYSEVLPSIRKTGGYVAAHRAVPASIYEPHTLTWDEAAALLAQRSGIVLTVNEMTRILRTGGVLKQNGAPTKKYRHLFWFTGTAWTIHPHVIPEIVAKVYDTGRELQDFRFIQARLQFEGIGDIKEISA